MKKFTKWLSLLLAIVLAVGIMAGCKPENPTTAPSTNGDNPTNGTTQPTQGTTQTPTEPEDITKFTEAPYITNLGTYGKVEDRLPVVEDIFVSQYDATGAQLEIGTYGGEINLIGGGGSWDISRPTLETIIRRNTDGSYYPNVIKSYE